MKNTFILFLFLLFGKKSFSNNDNTFNYVLNQHINKPDLLPLFGMESEFKTVRHYFKPFMFSETQLFTGSDSEYILYKIEKGVWYFKTNNKWNLFYDFKKKTGGYIKKGSLKTKVVFLKSIVIRNDTLHKIYFKSLKVYSTHNPRYYFSPTKGIIIISTNTGILLRKDCFKTSLLFEEYDKL